MRRPPGQGGTPVISAANRKDGNPFDAAANPIWRYANNYSSGYRGPYDVLVEMAEVEGVVEWVGTDVQVSDKSWEALERWYRSLTLA